MIWQCDDLATLVKARSFKIPQKEFGTKKLVLCCAQRNAGTHGHFQWPNSTNILNMSRESIILIKVRITWKMWFITSRFVTLSHGASQSNMIPNRASSFMAKRVKWRVEQLFLMLTINRQRQFFRCFDIRQGAATFRRQQKCKLLRKTPKFCQKNILVKEFYDT